MQQTSLSNPSLFWVLQIVGWSGYMLDRYLSAEGRFFPVHFIYLAVACALTFAMRPVYQRVWRRKPSVLAVGATIILCSIAAAYLWLIVGEIIFGLTGIRPFPVPDKKSLVDYLADTFKYSLQHHKPFLFLSWSALYFGIKYWQGRRAEEENALRAEAAAQEAELKMLRYQLNPHFLFNSLNSASALIRENPQRAERMIGELSEFLRYSLVNSKAGTVSLRDEIEALKNYLAIEQIRFEEKLRVDFDIASETENFAVPNFLLHPLVENAVKYGMQTSPGPLKIQIKTARRDGSLLIEIVNTGKWLASAARGKKAPAAGGGMRVGLENVRKRLEQFFPDHHRFETFETDGEVHVRLEIAAAA